MEALRKAMHEEGPMPGIISLTVARQKGGGGPSLPSTPAQVPKNHQHRERRDSFSSQVTTSSSDDMVREYNVSAPFRPPKQQQPSTSSLAHLRSNTRNPVVDRLMGKTSEQSSNNVVPADMRNESYYMATHQDTWNATMIQQQLSAIHAGGGPGVVGSGSKTAPASANPTPTPLDCPTVRQANRESLMIEQENNNGNNAGESGSVNASSSCQTNLSTNGSLPLGVFSRDQPGRQSMSEKRHATLDAKSTDTYQKRKKARDDRLRQQQLEHQQQRAQR